MLGQFAGPTHIIKSLVVATVLFGLLLIVYQRGAIGGGDVKLLTALAIGLPLTGIIQLLTVTALAGGFLAAAHLMLRLLPHPRPAPAGSALLRRIVAVERWRHVRRAPLPYGAAIACGGIWTLFEPRGLTMSSALRLSIIMVLMLATVALGLVAYNASLPKAGAPVAEIAPAPVTSGYFIAARPLPAGTLARDEVLSSARRSPTLSPRGRSSIRPRPRPGCVVRWCAGSSTPAA